VFHACASAPEPSAGSTGCWIPRLLESLDDRWWPPVWVTSRPKHRRLWYRNNSASFIIDHTGVELRHRVGVDNIMWSSDYPHHGNDWPYSRKVIEETMNSIPAEEKAKIVGGNASRIWHLGD
jgi:hypothetical protein